MIIVYLCSTGTLSSLIAANLHIGKIDLNINEQDIRNLKHFGEIADCVGKSLFIGQDEKNNLIYTLGISSEAQIIIRSAQDLLKINNSNKKIYFVDLSKYSPKNIYLYKLVEKIPLSKTLLAKILLQNLKKINYKVEKIRNDSKDV